MSINKEKIEELETLLKRHDWYYREGDAIRFNRGEKERNAIREKLKEVEAEIGEALYRKYMPKIEL